MSVSRRHALLAGLAALGGCNTIDDLLSTSKDVLPGKRESISLLQRANGIDVTDKRPVVLPPPVALPDWPQAGGIASHVGGHPALAGLSQAWSRSIGEGGGYRARLSAQPVVMAGQVVTMDSDGVVTAHDAAEGRRQWRTETQADEDRSTNVGGGVAIDAGTVFASTGRAELLALDAANGAIRWRKGLGTPARGAPTLVAGHVLVTTIDGRITSFAPGNGDQQWSYQATGQQTNLLGHSSPAVADGLVVAGLESGELVAIGLESGAFAWSENLSAGLGRSSLIDLSAIRGLPVIDRGRVFASGQGGISLSLDLRSGRRLWERSFGSSETPWVVGDWVFIQTVEQVLVAVNRDDGRLRWATELPRFGNPEKQRDPILWAGPVLAGGRLVLAGSNEMLQVVNPQDGALMSSQDLADVAGLAPVVAGGTMFVLTDDATLTAYR